MKSRTLCAAAALAFSALVVLAPNVCIAAKVPRAVLKEYFQTGDKPTQAQFQDLIDSSLNLVDDGLTSYTLRDSSSGAARFDVDTEIGPNPAFLDTHLVDGFSEDWLGQAGYLPLAFELNSQTHYGYLQISPNVPGATNPYAMFVEYLIYEDLPNTPIFTTQVPEPTTAVLALIGFVAALARRRRSRQARG
jgi:hypothetical protein